MKVEEAVEAVDCLMLNTGRGHWDAVPKSAIKDILESWRRTCKGDDGFKNLVATLKAGHTIQSPVCPEFQYRIGGLIGRQMSLV